MDVPASKTPTRQKGGWMKIDVMGEEGREEDVMIDDDDCRSEDDELFVAMM